MSLRSILTPKFEFTLMPRTPVRSTADRKLAAGLCAMLLLAAALLYGAVDRGVQVGLVFGLVHFEALQLLALSGFGMMLALIACTTGRLGPGIIAHVTFNTVTFVALATSH